MEYNGRRIASESKQTVRGGPKPAKVGLHRRLGFGGPPPENCSIFEALGLQFWRFLKQIRKQIGCKLTVYLTKMVIISHK